MTPPSNKTLMFFSFLSLPGAEISACAVCKRTTLLSVALSVPICPVWTVFVSGGFGFELSFSLGTNTLALTLRPGLLRACSHKPGTVNYPGVMTAPGQALPRVHTMICCPVSTSLPRGKFIVI